MTRSICCILVAMTMLLSGCASGPDLHRQRLENLPQHYRQFDMVLAWQIQRRDSQTIIDGELQNVRYAFMDDIEVWVAVLDASGKTTARSVTYVVPHQIRHDEMAPFSLTLPIRAEPGTRLIFTYRYTGSDGGSREGGANAERWTQSFETVVPGP